MAGKIFKDEIGQYDQENNLIQTFEGIAKVCENCKISDGTLRKRLKDGKIHNGYYYRYTGNKIACRFYENANNRNVRLDIENCNNLNLKVWELRICLICGKKFYARKKYEKITCCEECYNKYVEIHREEISEKQRIKSYDNFHSKSKEEIAAEHEKARQTSLKRYGVNRPQQTNEYRKKMSEMFMAKDWSERSRKANEVLIPKYISLCEADSLELIEFRNRFDCDVKCKECGFEFTTHTLGYISSGETANLCRHCHPNANSTSRTEPVIFVEKILEKYGIEFHKNDRFVIKPQEIDILIPSLKLAIEVNGVYWHSEIAGGKDKNYHIHKTKNAFNNGYKLIHIFDDEIKNKPLVVESRILNLIGKTPNKVYARKCNIKELDAKTKKEFLEKNHIDGDSVSKWNLGLYYNDLLVSVATFGKRKISGSENLELIRFASLINYNVIGGFSKLFKYFIETYNPERIITYADIRWSGLNYEDNVYTKNGFTYKEITKPNYFYTGIPNFSFRFNRFNFTKQKLVESDFDKNLTEREIMKSRGYDRIWDCGSLKFEYFRK